MIVQETGLSGVLLLKPPVYRDERGFFRETWRAESYRELGIPGPFVQDNVSLSARGVLRGLHFQEPGAQGKLVCVLRGAVWDVAVDVRAGSPTFGKWFGATLSDENGWQLWVPQGFAHGFVVTADEAVFAYKCTDVYRPEAEATIVWNDPALGIEWPCADPRVSPRDARGARLGELPPERLPRYTAGA